MLKKSCIAIPFVAAALTAPLGHAYEKGDFTIKAGAAHVEPFDSSSVIEIDTPALGPASDAEVGVGTNTQFGITFTYMCTDNLAVELLAATPFEHDVNATRTIAGLGKLGSTKHLPPTVTLNYFPLAADSKIQPYIGAGFNYTIFFDEEVDDTLDSAGTIDALAGLAGAAAGTITAATDTELDLDPSFGLAFHAGIDYAITENIGVSFAYWKIDIETDATITTQTNIGEVVAKTKVDIDPNVYMLGVSYTF